MSKVAVVLSGCGCLDGSEIHESVLSFLILEQKGHTYQCFAPDIIQKKVVNHITQEEIPGKKRNVLEESARIARGKILPLAELKADAFDAILLPGGFGAALNLSDFAELQDRCSIHPDLKVLLYRFHEQKKPILAICISPVILAKLFRGKEKLKMTLGSDPESAQLLEKMGMESVETKVDQACFDETHRIYTTPCYMEPDDLAGLYKGISQIVDRL